MLVAPPAPQGLISYWNVVRDPSTSRLEARRFHVPGLWPRGAAEPYVLSTQAPVLVDVIDDRTGRLRPEWRHGAGLVPLSRAVAGAVAVGFPSGRCPAER